MTIFTIIINPAHTTAATREKHVAQIILEQSDLVWAAQQGLVSPAQAAALWPALVARTQPRDRHPPHPGGSNLVQVSVYAGLLLVIGALSWPLSQASASSASALFLLALAYVAVFGAVGRKLWFDGQARYGIPRAVGGLLVTFAVSVSPTVTYAVGRSHLDQSPSISYFLVGLTLVAGGACALLCGGIGFPIITAPVAFGLYVLAASPRFMWPDTSQDAGLALLSFAVGLALNAVGFAIDRRTPPAHDFGFWFYAFGALSTVEGLLVTPLDLLGPYRCGLVAFAVIYIVAGALLNRQSLVALGSLGFCAYAGYFMFEVVGRDWSYPLVLIAVGFPISFFGVLVNMYLSKQASAADDAAQQYEGELQANTKEA